MIYIFDRASMAQTLKFDLDPDLHAHLERRFAALLTAQGDLAEWTEYLVVEPGDTENEIARQIGFSPLVDPLDGRRFGSAGFRPHWDYLADIGGWFEMILTFGSTFAYVLIIKDAEGVPADLLRLCRKYAQ